MIEKDNKKLLTAARKNLSNDNYVMKLSTLSKEEREVLTEKFAGTKRKYFYYGKKYVSSYRQYQFKSLTELHDEMSNIEREIDNWIKTNNVIQLNLSCQNSGVSACGRLATDDTGLIRCAKLFASQRLKGEAKRKQMIREAQQRAETQQALTKAAAILASKEEAKRIVAQLKKAYQL